MAFGSNSPLHHLPATRTPRPCRASITMPGRPHDIADTEEMVSSIREIRGAIRFDNVSFRYGEEGPWVLRDVSFHVPAGSTLAVVGRTGSGKTTLVEMIPRLLEATQGTVRIDDRRIRPICCRCTGYSKTPSLTSKLRSNITKTPTDNTVVIMNLLRFDRFFSCFLLRSSLLAFKRFRATTPSSNNSIRLARACDTASLSRSS